MGGEVNQLLESLKDRDHNMGCNDHATSLILTIPYGNATYINLFDNYIKFSIRDI